MSDKRFAHVIGGAVTNIIIAAQESIARAVAEGGDIIEDLAETVGIGDQWDGVVFTRPAPPEPVPYVDPVQDQIDYLILDNLTLADQQATQGLLIDELILISLG